MALGTKEDGRTDIVLYLSIYSQAIIQSKLLVCEFKSLDNSNSNKITYLRFLHWSMIELDGLPVIWLLAVGI